MSHVKDRLARAWVEDLKSRLPANHVIYPQRRPKHSKEIEPPFTVLAVMRAEQTTPGSNTWTAEVRVVVVCDKDQEGSPGQERRVQEIYQALEATPVPAADESLDLRLYGFSLDEIREAKADKVYSDVIFVTAGAGNLASSPDAQPLW